MQLTVENYWINSLGVIFSSWIVYYGMGAIIQAQKEDKTAPKPEKSPSMFNVREIIRKKQKESEFYCGCSMSA